MTFEIKDRDAAGRLCKFTTAHGTVMTPNLLPVINPNKMLISPKEMQKRFGTEILITNAYIIYKDPALRQRALEHGVHDLIDFSGTIMTDSGTFQSYVYGDVNLDPLEIVRFQRTIGSDIGTILDIFGTPDQTKKEAEQGVRETVLRASRSIPEKGDMLLACPVQGSIYPDVREYCARQLSALNADFFPIGGVVPLMENQQYATLTRCILAAKQGLDPSKPVHLFGAGHPLVFPLAVALGCDFFDSSAYAKYANDGRMIFPWGTEKLEDLSELPCCCPVCSSYTPTELKKLESQDRVVQLALHNLSVSFSELKTIRTAITQGWLWELVEQKASANSALSDALRVLREPSHQQWLEQYEPASRTTALFYTGPHTIHRPTIARYHSRILSRYEPLFRKTVVFPEGRTPYSMFYPDELKANLQKKMSCVVRSHLGPVPFELDEMYPLAQSVFPEVLDRETEKEVQRLTDRFLRKIVVISREEASKVKRQSGSKKEVDWDLRRVSAVADMQFGRGASKVLLPGDVSIVKSKRTGKIRNVFCDRHHILSMRAEDGFFTLKLEGGQRLHQGFKHPMLRVVVIADAVPFVREGKSVFAKFVSDCDPDLRPYDECLVVDENDTLLGIGRTMMNRTEMFSFHHGMAVKIREYIKKN
jgi:7-cyano-7-deazaguanine tRNA-ribosyltransferase